MNIIRLLRKIQFKLTGTETLLKEIQTLKEQLNQVNEHINFVDKQNEVTREQLNQVNEHINFVDKQNEVTREQLNQVNNYSSQLPYIFYTLFNRINSVYRQNLVTAKTTKNTKVIYTCITDNYDDLIMHSYIDNSWDYVCFTDNTQLIELKQFGNWKIVSLQFSDFDGTRNNRWHKLHPHKILSEYTQSIYIDANIDIKTPYVFECVNQAAKEGREFSIPPHYERACLYEEGKIVVSSLIDDKDTVEQQMHRYKNEGFPENYGLTENSLIYRKHNELIVQNIMNDWWYEIENNSKRDQLSLFYVLWKNNYAMTYLTEIALRLDIRNFEFLPHGKKQVLTKKDLFSRSSSLKI